MHAKTERTLFYLMNSIQSGKIYEDDHPTFLEFVNKLNISLQDFFLDKKELIIGIVEDEIAWEQEIFFDLSQNLRPLINFLKECNIERLVFQHGLEEEEVRKFLVFLTRTKAQERVDPEEYFSLHGIRNIRAGRFKALVQMKNTQENVSERTIRQYNSSLDTVVHSFNTVLNNEEVDFLDLRFNLLNVLENFMGRHQELLNLISVRQKDLITFVHLLNVSVLSMYFASRIGFSKDEVLDIGTAALFHDVGKLSISRRILKKKSKLDDDEFSIMQDHPFLGAKILTHYQESLGVLPVVVAFEHHLRFDLTGYPKVSYPRKPHTASLIVSMCDVYDALAQRRTYKKDVPPNKIYEIMIAEKGKQFDPELLDRFFQIMGVWPIGTIVSLSDKSVAVVREINEGKIFHPIVEVLSPKKKRKTLNLARESDGVEITAALNPYGKGKKYLDLV